MFSSTALKLQPVRYNQCLKQINFTFLLTRVFFNFDCNSQFLSDNLSKVITGADRFTVLHSSDDKSYVVQKILYLVKILNECSCCIY